MNEHADAALLVEAYYLIAAQIDDAGAKFVEHAPSDTDRQYRLQSKLMTAVLACFIRTMPSLTNDELLGCVNIALVTAAQRDPDAPTSVDVN